MKNIPIIALCFFVCGCVPHYADYQPKLSLPPKDSAKYEADRKICLDGGLARKKNAASFSADSAKTPRQMVDECMADKGYAVIKQEHCC